MNSDIRKTAELFIERNGIVEVRAIASDNPKKKHIASGYYDDVDILVKAVERIDDSASVNGIYIGLNKPKTEHAHNLNLPISRSTRKLSDKHIERITSVLIDLDPERETGTNATAEELEAARLRCFAVIDALTEIGFPEPSILMSGNGYHGLYATDLPVKDKTLVRDFLKALDRKFSDSAVKVDTTVYNPARITKLYGTMTRKGLDTPERPQRRSKIISTPDDSVEVKREQLQMIIDEWGAPAQTKPLPMSYQAPPLRTKNTTRSTVDVPAYCQKAGLEIVGTKVEAGATIYQLKHCAFDPHHSPNEASIIQGADGIARYQCFHDSCQGRTFQEACNVLNCWPDEWNRNEPEGISGVCALDETPLPEWPTLGPDALKGFAGDFVDLATKNSEADPAAVLLTFLVRVGVEAGRGNVMAVGDTKHKPILASVVVGSSSKSRKGTSAKPVDKLFSFPETLFAAFSWPTARTSKGPFSSGEGIIYAIRDAVKKYNVKDQQEEIVDPGVEDKRLFVLDEEFGGVLANTKREGNTLSMIIRQMWDGGTLDPLTKNNKIRATGGVVGWVSHITLRELAARLAESESFNGFANRILWCLACRQKLVPIPAPMPRQELENLQIRLLDILQTAEGEGSVELGPEARQSWCDRYYADLTKDRPGLAGCTTNRGEAQVLRLAMIYCLLDGEQIISLDHLEAGVAVWEYCRQSANYIFAGRQEDATAQRIVEAITQGPMTRTELHRLFQNNVTKDKIQASLKELIAAKQIIEDKDTGTGGAPSKVYRILKEPLRIKRNNEITPTFDPSTESKFVNSLNSSSDNKKPSEITTQIAVSADEFWEVD